MSDDISSPEHYTSASIESIDLMMEIEGEEAVANFCICNVWKYLYRHNKKGGLKDLQKAAWYLQKYFDLMDVENSEENHGYVEANEEEE